ncbi:MAG: hypothetical protein Q9O62_02950 [Ardenticatenia bacterium]|nr:hypothetical protein [Ardenticatenia bacterium]
MVQRLFIMLDLVGVVCFSALFLFFLMVKLTAHLTGAYDRYEHFVLNMLLLFTGSTLVGLLAIGIGSVLLRLP